MELKGSINCDTYYCIRCIRVHRETEAIAKWSLGGFDDAETNGGNDVLPINCGAVYSLAKLMDSTTTVTL